MSFRTRIAARLLIVLALWSTPSCLLVEYSDSLVDERVRSNFVTQPASIGGILGFIVGVPFDVVGLPVTYTIYRINKSEEEETLDPLSTLLFPSFVLGRAGVLVIGTPFDVLEFIFYRAWRRPPAQELPDLEIDDPGSDRERRRPEAARSR